VLHGDGRERSEAKYSKQHIKKNHARGGKFLFLKKKIGKIHRRRVCHNHAKNKVKVKKEAVGAVAKDPLNV